MSATSVLDKHPRVADEAGKYPKPAALGSRGLQYGTAGFREEASLLPSTCHRMGMLAVLRSKSLSKITGIMITASHNPSSDNGLKLIDPTGDMLSQSWEKYAMQLANASHDKVVEVLDAIVAAEKINLDQPGNVFIAKDTRQSSEHLAELAREGALVIGGNVLDFGLQTTPQLHHFVRMWNYENYNKGDWASELGYYNMLVDAFKQMTAHIDSKKLEMRTPLYVDCAHGVGALQLAKLAKELGESLHLEILNTPSDGELNHECGAEYAQKARKSPSGFSRDSDRDKRCCSLDGDADRVVFHFFDDQGVWHLLDGDKIACLFAEFFAERVHLLEADLEGVSLGCVQTGYANGASTKYMESKGIRVVRAKTGVKHCHKKALEFDIGVYFEANGHGTVVVKDSVVERLQKLDNTIGDEKKKRAISQLLAVHQLINQATGDAISDLLLVEVILIQKNWSIANWNEIYHDMPSRQTKVQISDREVLKMDKDDDTKLLAPEAVRDELKTILDSYADKQGRAFIRPSGTENAVRVYAEAARQDWADELALAFAKLVHERCGGLGAVPTEFVA